MAATVRILCVMLYMACMISCIITTVGVNGGVVDDGGGGVGGDLSEYLNTDVWLGERDCPMRCNAACECKSEHEKLCVTMCPQCLLQGIPCGLKVTPTKTPTPVVKKQKKIHSSSHVNLMEMSASTRKKKQHHQKAKKKHRSVQKKAEKVARRARLRELMNSARNEANQEARELTKPQTKVTPLSGGGGGGGGGGGAMGQVMRGFAPPPPPRPSPSMYQFDPSQYGSVIEAERPAGDFGKADSLMGLRHYPFEELSAVGATRHQAVPLRSVDEDAQMHKLIDLQHQIIEEVEKLHPELSVRGHRNGNGAGDQSDKLADVLRTVADATTPNTNRAPRDSSPDETDVLRRRIEQLERRLDNVASRPSLMQPCCGNMNTMTPPPLLPSSVASNNFLQQLHANLGTAYALGYDRGRVVPKVHPQRGQVYEEVVQDLQKLVQWIQARRAAGLPPSDAVSTMKSLLDQALIFSTARH